MKNAGQNSVTVETFLPGLREQWRQLRQVSSQQSKHHLCLRMIGWGGYASSLPDDGQELLKAFLSVIESHLKSETPNSADLETFLTCCRNGHYIQSLLSVHADGEVTVSPVVLNGQKVGYNSFDFYATKENVLVLIRAIKQFVSDEAVPKVKVLEEKYILAIIDQDGGVHPVIPSNHQDYDVTQSAYEKFRLADYVLFDSVDAIETAIKTHPVFTKVNAYSSGLTFPPRALHNGLGICNTRTSSEGEYQISKVTVEVVKKHSTGVYAVDKTK